MLLPVCWLPPRTVLLLELSLFSPLLLPLLLSLLLVPLNRARLKTCSFALSSNVSVQVLHRMPLGNGRRHSPGVSGRPLTGDISNEAAVAPHHSTRQVTPDLSGRRTDRMSLSSSSDAVMIVMFSPFAPSSVAPCVGSVPFADASSSSFSLRELMYRSSRWARDTHLTQSRNRRVTVFVFRRLMAKVSSSPTVLSSILGSINISRPRGWGGG